MTHQVNVYEAKTQLSKLLDWVLAGEEVVIARSGKPIARLTPIEPPMQPRVPGIDIGKIFIGPNFDDLITVDSEFSSYQVQVIW